MKIQRNFRVTSVLLKYCFFEVFQTLKLFLWVRSQLYLFCNTTPLRKGCILQETIYVSVAELSSKQPTKNLTICNHDSSLTVFFQSKSLASLTNVFVVLSFLKRFEIFENWKTVGFTVRIYVPKSRVEFINVNTIKHRTSKLWTL